MSLPDFDELKKKIRRPIPMRGIECKVAAAVTLWLAFGLTCSVSLRDWQYFERSGALVILVAIVLAWRDLVSLVGDVERLYQEVIEGLRSKINAARPRGLINTATQDGVQESFEELNELDAALVALNKLLRKRIRTIEAIVLGVGTLVWEYGAPLANLVWRFSDT